MPTTTSDQAASAQSAAIQLGASIQIIYSGNDAVQQTQQILGSRPNAPMRFLVEPVGPDRHGLASGIAWAIIKRRRHETEL